MAVALAVAVVACDDRKVERPDPGPPIEEIDLDGLQVAADDDDVVFQYVDPATGKPVAVTDIEEIPVRLVNRWEFKPAGLKDREGEGAAQATDRVVLYTAPGCGHCDRARRWFQEKGLAFEEKDVQSDPGAAAEVAALGKAQGLPESYLSSVPLINVKGKILVGFDPRQVEAALKR